MTLFITFLGVAAFLFGLFLGFPVLSDHGDAWVIGYLGTLVAFAVGALVVGWWWFVRGEGERRLRSVLDT